MVAFTLDQLYGWLTAFLWPLARVLGLFSTAPIFGESSVPVRVKLWLGVAVTLVISPTIGPLPNVAPASFAGLGIMAQQILIGVAMGLTMRMIFATVQTTGEFIGLQMGLSFATLFDPATNANTTVLSRLFNLVTLLVFLALDGHLLMLAGLAHSFQTVPILERPFAMDGIGVMIDWSAQVIISGLVMALPLVTTLLTINLAMGILNRTAPQLSVFAVGFPLSLLAGLVMLAVVVPQYLPFLEGLIANGLDAMSRVASGFGQPL